MFIHLFWLAHRQKSERLLYCDHVAHDGEGLFRLACEHDLEGVVAKRKYDPYLRQQASWLKIRNHDYSQWAGREELFERERGVTRMCGCGTSVWKRAWRPYSCYAEGTLVDAPVQHALRL